MVASGLSSETVNETGSAANLGHGGAALYYSGGGGGAAASTCAMSLINKRPKRPITLQEAVETLI
jgi:hypothetical protein